MSTSDRAIVAAILEGDSNCFQQLVERYQGLVFSIIYHYLGRRNEVEDMAQDVFLKVFRSLSSFDPERPMKSWIARITTNTCLDELRRWKTSRTQLFSDMATSDEEGFEEVFDHFCKGSVVSETQAETMFGHLQRLMKDLPEKDRMAFVLREMEGLDYAEIAQALESSQVAVRIRVSRSKKRLLEALKEAAAVEQR